MHEIFTTRFTKQKVLNVEMKDQTLLIRVLIYRDSFLNDVMSHIPELVLQTFKIF